MRKDKMRQVSARETEILLGLLEESLEVLGDVVEMGCYRGDSSLLFEKLLEKKQGRADNGQIENEQTKDGQTGAGRKRLWIYDSFEGLPKKSEEDVSGVGEQFKEGELVVSKREVVNRFKKAGLRVPRIRKGFFEELDPEKDMPGEICFGFLDGDLYRSIKTSFGLCVPKMTLGGVLVVHDYNNPELPGVSRAVEEFLVERNDVKFSNIESLAILRF